MKLTAQTLRVKPVSPSKLWLASLLTGAGLLLIFVGFNDDDAHLQHFGESLTRSLASQVVEPLMSEDLIHLSVLANRIIELPEISGAAVLTVDDTMLALSGDLMRGRTFSRQVVHNGATVGMVRINVDPSHFESATPGPVVGLAALWMLLVPMILLLPDFLSGVLPSARTGSLKALIPRAHHDPEAMTTDDTILQESESEPCYLLSLNLFNQLSLTPEQCTEELTFARGLAAGVAERYDAEIDDLPGTGLLLRFPAASSDDRPFHVVCAARLTAQLFEATESRGRYRFGLHVIENVADPENDETTRAADNGIEDAAVLSALAKDNQLVASEAFFIRIPFNQRLVATPMAHPLLDQLGSIGGGAYLLRGLAEPHEDLLSQQVEELLYPLRSTASESTF